ncbi:MAG: DUF3667 domain-containing protein [Bacteroidetes bacterium]|nr:DUF3667 domain-containing protein [Bacteroidota bacterium]
MQTKIEKCVRCNSELYGQFCSNCGHSQVIKRINREYILSEIGSVLNFDKGILYTIKELLVRPGLNIQKFILEDRNRLVKPIIFVIITSLIYTIAQQWLNFEDGYVNYSDSKDTAILTIFEWVQQNYGYANILMAIFIALWIKLFFRKYNFNFFEILILLCFVMGIGMLIYTIFGITESLTEFKVLQIGGLLGFVYVSWAIGRFFDKKKKINYLKGFLSYILGMLTFTLAAIALGTTIDFLIN